MNVEINNDKVYLNDSQIGWIEGNIYFQSGLSFHTERGESGVLHKFESFGLSEEVVERLFQYGVDYIIIHYEDGKEKSRYYATISDFINGKTFNNPQREDDLQLHVPKREMEKVLVCKKY